MRMAQLKDPSVVSSQSSRDNTKLSVIQTCHKQWLSNIGNMFTNVRQPPIVAHVTCLMKSAIGTLTVNSARALYMIMRSLRIAPGSSSK